MTDYEAIMYFEKASGYEAQPPLMREAIKTAIKALERTYADGCRGCAFGDVGEWELPCTKCKRNSKDYWRAKT